MGEDEARLPEANDQPMMRPDDGDPKFARPNTGWEVSEMEGRVDDT